MVPWADTVRLINVTVDGFKEQVPEGINLTDLIHLHRAQHKDLLVELGGRFVPPGDYDSTILKDGDRVELIHPAFGG